MATIAEKLQTILDAKNDIKAAMKERDLEGNYEPVNDDITGYGDKIRNAYSDVDGMMYAGSKFEKFPEAWKFAPRKAWKINWDILYGSDTDWDELDNAYDNYWSNEETNNTLIKKMKETYGDDVFKLIVYQNGMFNNECCAGGIFSNCYFLEYIPFIDTSNLDFFGCMFSNCWSLKEIPDINTSNGKDFSFMFYSCGITKIPAMDTSQGMFFDDMFSYCVNLISVPALDCSNGLSGEMMFSGCTSLTDMGGLVGIKFSINLYSCPLTHDSLMNIINNLATLSDDDETCSLSLNPTCLAMLSDDEKKIATDKNWKINTSDGVPR